MGKRELLARILAILGTVLVVLPLIVPFLFSLRWIGSRVGWRLDYLMPFEVYPVTLAGAALLVWAALRAHTYRGAVGITIGVMLGSLVLSGLAAQLTGIANSVEQLETWRYVLTAGLGGISLLAQAALVVVGCRLVRTLPGKPGRPEPSPG